jgi:alkanesulfonate monooxygenase SsuD/methylene tetrahydromethanopterin reductase-like flavin-dependent oxidoreductase (luciferase family)
MKISLLLEMPVPRPWTHESEQRAFNDALCQLELADRVGFHAAWFTEHHFLEEYSHISAPEIFMAALSQRTRTMRLGFGIKHMPPAINHPARVAEQVATLDLLSGGRVDWGTGEASSVAELDGFLVDPGQKRRMWQEATLVAARCLAEEPFSGYAGDTVTMPPRNVVPKPLQRPHPPLWLACTRQETIDLASSYGQGALSFTLLQPEDFIPRVKQYYDGLYDARPMTRSVNPNIAAPIGDMLCAPTVEQAQARLGTTDGFFGFGLAHYYSPGVRHHPGRTDLWAEFTQLKRAAGPAQTWGLVGSPETIREELLRWESTGVDEIMFVIPPTDHDAIMESFALFGEKVLPEFHERDQASSAAKAERLEPVIEAALARVEDPVEVSPDFSFGGVPVSRDQSHRASEIADVLAAWGAGATD